jgi:hypothetical protein
MYAQKQRAAVIITTDGEATDGNIADAMRPLQDLPVWVVIRICTDDDKIVQYWNGIDEELELEIDVLDDLSAEAQEVQDVNGFISYGEPLHKLREFGATIKEFDLIDESLLSPDQMRIIVALLIGDGDHESIPHPQADWQGFLRRVKALNTSSQPTYNPLTKKNEPWVNIKGLTKLYGKQSSSACVLC